jgi:hypothetical protein
MSRSRKKPWITDTNSARKFFKRTANKTVRKYKSVIPDGMGYKKLYCSWNICDYRWLQEIPHENDDMYDWQYRLYIESQRK